MSIVGSAGPAHVGAALDANGCAAPCAVGVDRLSFVRRAPDVDLQHGRFYVAEDHWGLVVLKGNEGSMFQGTLCTQKVPTVSAVVCGFFRCGSSFVDGASERHPSTVIGRAEED